MRSPLIHWPTFATGTDLPWGLDLHTLVVNNLRQIDNPDVEVRTLERLLELTTGALHLDEAGMDRHLDVLRDVHEPK